MPLADEWIALREQVTCAVDDVTRLNSGVAVGEGADVEVVLHMRLALDGDVETSAWTKPGGVPLPLQELHALGLRHAVGWNHHRLNVLGRILAVVTT